MRHTRVSKAREDNLKREMEAHIARCLLDRRYYYAAHLKVVSEQSKLVPFGQLFPTQAKIQDQIDSDREEGRPTRLIVLKSRRHRISTLVAANIFHACTFYENRRGYVVAHDVDTTQTLFRMHSVFYENLDAMVRPMKRFSNRKEMLFENPDAETRRVTPGLGSSITVRSASSGAKKISGSQGAAGVGRGDRIDMLHGSEVAFWPRGEETFRGFAQAVPDEPDTMVVIESTANGQGGFFYDTWWQAVHGEVDYTPIFIPWFEHPHYCASYVGRNRSEWLPTDDEFKRFQDYQGHLLTNEDSKAAKIGAMLGIDDEEERLVRNQGVGWDNLKWRRWCIRARCGGKTDIFHVEYPSTPEEAFIASGRPRFNNEKIRVFIDKVKSPETGVLTTADEHYDWQREAFQAPKELKFEPDKKGWIHIIEPPREDHSYIIGADASHGVGQDSAAFVVFDRTERRFVAYGKDPWLKPDKLARQMLFAGWHYNNAWLAPEYNGPGMLTTHTIVESGYPRMYYTQRYNTLQQSFTDHPGFHTDNRTRDMIIDRFDVALENESVDVPIKAILDEALTFVLDEKRNRADHLAGCHDDVLFAAMIALFVHNQVSADDVPIKEVPRQARGWRKTPPKVDDKIESQKDDDQLLLFL